MTSDSALLRSDGPAAAPVVHTAYARLVLELDAWQAEGRVATFWWRDDDAVAATPELDRLIAVAERYGVPLVLAVIPAHLDPGLPRRLDGTRRVTVAQHGWSHQDHSRDDEKSIELTDNRPAELVDRELRQGDDRLRAAFGDRYRLLLVPPWNRIGPATADRALSGRYPAISGFGARAAGEPGWCNVHVDPIHWNGHRGFLGEEAVTGQFVAHLSARRTGAADADEPTGLMTHHLVHDAAGWAFLEAVIPVIRDHPAARWLSVDESMPGADRT